MKKGKIYYNNKTGKIIGTYRPNYFNYKNIPSDFYMEIEEKDWLEFLNKNQGKEFFLEDGKLIARDFSIDIKNQKNLKRRELKELKEELLEKMILNTITEEDKNNYKKKLEEFKNINNNQEEK